jgi:tryptophanyl-tRNA synthetase
MSSSDEMATIYTTDTPKNVSRKVGRAFTGGCVSVDEQREKGGNPDICAVYMYNFYLFEHDDAELARIAGKCRSGEILCGECKVALAQKINVFLEGHQARREEARELIDGMAFGGFKW